MKTMQLSAKFEEGSLARVLVELSRPRARVELFVRDATAK